MYNPQSIESKWQKYWLENKTFAAQNPPFSGPAPKKAYVLDMFPYPSGVGLHVGHPKGFIASDVVSRQLHNMGYNVLHTIGWDAFGLPAENFAIKTGTHPRITTEKNIANYRRQLTSLGFAYDWDREVDTTDPEYYRWTQWIFLKLFEQGLAYEQDLPINYCPSCKTGLANEEVNADNTCDRCGTVVERRPIRQWVLRITDYAERLLADVDKLEWPEGIKEMQRNWIGKSEGVEFSMRKAVEDKPVALILHGWEGKAESNWFMSTKKSLEEIGYEVIVPNLPNPNTPNLNEQLTYLAQFKTRLTDQSVIIGHSLGGQLAAKFIETLDNKINTLILVAPTYPGVADDMGITDRILNENEKAFIPYTQQGVDFEKVSQNTRFQHLHISQNDPYIALNAVKEYYRNIPELRVTTYENKGHFNEDSGVTRLPEIIDGIMHSLSVYTTRIDTVYGMTYAVMASDHPQVHAWIAPSELAACEQYIAESKSKSDLDRTESKEKTGVFTGSYVINPFNNEKIPVYIGDYVLGSYGTGAVMAVPAHDERDFEFAKKMGLPIIKVIVSPEENSEYDKLDEKYDIDSYDKDPQQIDIMNRMDEIEDILAGDKAYTEDGFLIKGNGSGSFLDEKFLDEVLGSTSAEARQKLTLKAEGEGFGKRKVNYKLRDWLFSRQRYWGEPIPLVHLDLEDLKKLPHITSLAQATDVDTAYILKRAPLADEKCDGATCGDHVRVLVIGGKEISKIYDGLKTKIICDYNLPLELPDVERYEPAGDGNSPLATVEAFVNVQLAANLSGKRETNTMPQWGGSCWYYLRYMDPKNREALVSPEAMNYWGSVDQYVGGAEHAVLHLLYARFWHKVLFDIGVVSYDEPFAKLASPGLILGADGNKMSKSKGNVVNPDSVVEQYGTDTFRLYEMSMSDFRDPAPWNTDAISGSRRLLDKVWNAMGEDVKYAADDMKAMKLLHKTVKKITEDIPLFKFNTAIAALNILLNEGAPRDTEFLKEWREKIVVLLHPFAPHLAEELWNMLGHTESVYFAPWPTFDEFMLVDDEVTIAVQVNGKLRGTFTFLAGVAQEEVSTVVRENEDIAKWLAGKEIVREIFVPGKLLSIVVKDL